MAIVRWKPLGRWDPFEDLMEIQRGVSRLFSRTFEGPDRSWVPAVDVAEDENTVVVKAELPGMDEKDIDISVDENTLMIKGEKKAEQDIKEENYHRIERVYGTFQRVLTLPAPIDSDKVEAVYKNGVLEITCPKLEGVKPKKIAVKAG